MAADIATQLAIERLLARYVATIDEGRLDEWPGYFVEDCRYQIISSENYEKGLPIGVFFADSRGMLQDRVSSLREASVYEAQRYRHLVSSTLILSAADGIVTARSNYMVARIMHDGAMTLFSTGRYLDRITLRGAEPLFEERLVVFDSKRIDTLLAIPL
jgi:anthranilate 1,2-dioxygenase small subunit